jgi:hypothetical protein
VRALAELGTDGLALMLADDATVAAVSEGLAAEDDDEAIKAAWTLADTGSPAALDPLLVALGSARPLDVRWTVRLALERLVSGWPEGVRELELGPRRERLAARAASAPLWFAQAVLEGALGMEETTQTLEKARHDAADDPLPLAEALARGKLPEPERALVAEQLRAMLTAIPGEGCERRRLLALATSGRADLGGCPDVPAEVKNLEARRLAAIASLARLSSQPSMVLRAQLGRLAERDGSPAVREAAKRALAGADTLSTSTCTTATALIGFEGR